MFILSFIAMDIIPTTYPLFMELKSRHTDTTHNRVLQIAPALRIHHEVFMQL